MTLAPVLRGKVRDVFDAGDDRLAMVASDRISAYDVVMPTPIPDKGRVLTGLSLHWFAKTADIVPNHVLGARRSALPEPFRTPEHAGRTTLVRRLQMLPVECVARGYLAGSGWRDYRETGAVCGHPLPPGLAEFAKLPEPIFTPATKAHEGHDENITREQAADLVGGETLAELERITLAVYARAAGACRLAGMLLADTKLELGRDAAGTITLGDELLTPDSSRFWPADAWSPGQPRPSYDKQYVRDWLDARGFDRTPPGPELPAEVVAGTRARYLEAYERLAARTFASYLRDAAA